MLVERVCALLMIALVVDVFLGVFSRYVLQATFKWYDEVARLCFVWIIFLGAAVAVRRRLHFRVHLLIDRLRPAARANAGRFVTLTVIAFGTVMMGGFLVLAAFNTFAMLVIMFVGRRWGEYALIRPGREMLFSGFDNETKYKAKNFIDVPVYRAADFIGAQGKTAIDAITASPVASLVIGSVMAGVWAAVGWGLGKRKDGR